MAVWLLFLSSAAPKETAITNAQASPTGPAHNAPSTPKKCGRISSAGSRKSTGGRGRSALLGRLSNCLKEYTGAELESVQYNEQQENAQALDCKFIVQRRLRTKDADN